MSAERALYNTVGQHFMTLRRIILTLSIITIFSCQGIDKMEKVNVSQEIADLKSVSEKEKYLEKILETDQNIRNGKSSDILLKYGKNSKELQEFNIKMDSVDQLNLKRVDYYLNEFGYPDIEIFSKNATIAPWLVIHHSSDVHIRNKYFPVLKKAYKNGNISSDEFELYLGRTYRIINGKYPISEGPYKPEDKINRLIKELGID